mmetsp:Transcript_4533/g.8241  ORF Transcript_4533/g.8241 Transcript_4533/m.8241 type:complete len:274 (+) Transcript_4533:559-1380(+)
MRPVEKVPDIKLAILLGNVNHSRARGAPTSGGEVIGSVGGSEDGRLQPFFPQVEAPVPHREDEIVVERGALDGDDGPGVAVDAKLGVVWVVHAVGLAPVRVHDLAVRAAHEHLRRGGVGALEGKLAGREIPAVLVQQRHNVQRTPRDILGFALTAFPAILHAYVPEHDTPVRRGSHEEMAALGDVVLRVDVPLPRLLAPQVHHLSVASDLDAGEPSEVGDARLVAAVRRGDVRATKHRHRRLFLLPVVLLRGFGGDGARRVVGDVPKDGAAVE